MGNQQSHIFNNNQLQVLLTASLGDGCITYNNSSDTYRYRTNCIYYEYLLYKQKLLGELSYNIGYVEKNGYSQNPIFTLTSKELKEIGLIKNLSLQDTLNSLDELGIALWIYDDGSLHNSKYFYNINTQSFDYFTQVKYFIPFFNKLGIFPNVVRETKKDGREFYYLNVSRYKGSYEITNILNKYPLDCYKYKVWDSETILKWSKLQEWLKNTDRENLSNMQLAKVLRKVTL